MQAADPPRAARGLELLLAHCAVLTFDAEPRPSARVRLEEAVGGEFARLLLAALSGDKGRGRFKLVA